MSDVPVMSETGNADAGMRALLPRRDRLLLRIAAPSWRRRHLVEFTDVLAQTPAGLRRTGGIAVLIIRSWLRPGRHLHQSQERLLASLSTLLVIGVAVLAGLVVYWFVSVPLPAASQPPGAGFHYLCAAVAAALFTASLWPMLTAARGRAARGIADVVLPITYAVSVAAAGVAVFSAIPGPDRIGLGPASWLVVPAVIVFAAVPGVAVAIHRTVQRLRPRPGLLTLGSAWLATIAAILAVFCEPAVRETAVGSGNWQMVLFWFCLSLAVTATTSTLRGLRAVLADRRRQRTA